MIHLSYIDCIPGVCDDGVTVICTSYEIRRVDSVLWKSLRISRRHPSSSDVSYWGGRDLKVCCREDVRQTRLESLANIPHGDMAVGEPDTDLCTAHPVQRSARSVIDLQPE